MAADELPRTNIVDAFLVSLVERIARNAYEQSADFPTFILTANIPAVIELAALN